LNGDELQAENTDYANMQIENIYGIPNDKEKQQVKTAKLLKAKTEKLTKKNQEYKDKFANFNKSLKKEDLDELLALKTDLVENDQVSVEQLNKIKVNTSALYKKGF
jgi:hypothetical protein